MYKYLGLALTVSVLLVTGCGKGEKIPDLAGVTGTLTDTDGEIWTV